MENDRKKVLTLKSNSKLAILTTLLILGFCFTIAHLQVKLSAMNFLEQIFVPVTVNKPILIKVPMDIDSLEQPSGKPLALADNLAVSSQYGLRVHPISKQLKFHSGVDIGCPIGHPIIATACGKIIRIQYQLTGYGNNIVIEHNGTYRTLYAHLDEISVKVDQFVEKGQVIGYSGNSGTSTAPHIHYEIVMNNKKIDPLPYL